ncbi:hypothetical protein CALVIDRAFT_238431 [Calocera viscosa TUFC12733]|uniref:DUF6535 domain-containing protein n=1 Tax=Calocera viscosa (strain TUFC12733) TaxID=1330018 RepID=A0A167JV90_CALVF|nr:hypothetical protein CALVIDRAFT_238431 [Calocera viscosa TUFC12733]
MNPSETIHGGANEHALPAAKIIYSETRQEGGFVYDIGPELSHAEDAPIWNTYRKHAAAWDKDYLASLDDTLNVFLLFATLFSAVVAPFLIDSNARLQPDTQQAAVDALTRISAQLAASQDDAPPPIAYDGDSAINPASWLLAVNALWLVSLLISLVSTVFAVSVKQWLTSYKEGLPAATLPAVRERHERYIALDRWKISILVNSLPMVINIAVFIFLAGLVIYIWNASTPLGGLLCGLLVGSMGLYFVTVLLPIIIPRCPYQSILTKSLSHWLDSVVKMLNTLPIVFRTETKKKLQVDDDEDSPLLREKLGANASFIPDVTRISPTRSLPVIFSQRKSAAAAAQVRETSLI